MDELLSPTVAGILMLASGSIPGYVVYWLRTEPQGIVVRWFRFAMLCGMVWSVTFGLIVLVDSSVLRLAITNLLIIAVPSSAFAIFAFSYEFTFREPVPRPFYLLYVPVALLFVLSWFNPGQLVYPVAAPYQASEILILNEVGPFRLVLNVIGGLLAVVMAAGLVTAELLRTNNRTRAIQAGVVLLLILSIFVPSVIKVLGFVPLYFDPSVFGWSIVGVVVATTFKRFDLFWLSPNAKRRVFDELPDPVVILNPDGNVSDANEAAMAVLDVEIGMTTAALREANPALEDVLDGTAATVELSVDGSRRVFEYTEQKVSQGYGTEGCVLFFRDVTAQTTTAERLAEKTDRLEAFATRVSHDLRGPITNALSQTKLARREVDEPTELDEIAETLTHAERLIDDILAMARSGQEPECEPIAVATLATQAWSTVSTPDASLVVETEQTISADSGQLLRLLENLFRNAVEHGGDDVTVRLGSNADGFYVADDGVGIPVEHRESVFEERTTFDDGGTGYGLAIVSDIADAHGWSVSVTESESGGARFDISGVTLVDT
ncbi:MAG: ATP-binding protein, partial [Haloarculaceae archaeon]